MGESDVVRDEEVARLPDPVERWLRRAGVVGHERIRTVRLKQKGILRQAPDKPWTPFSAEQYYTTDAPAFVWHACVGGFGSLPMVVVEDSLNGGQAMMRVRLGALIPLGVVRGPELNQGAMLRYLSEVPWFPTAAVSPFIEWHPVDATSAKATITWQGVAASALFQFDDAGDIANMTADRYRTVGKGFSLDRWSTPTRGHKEFAGLRIPNRGEAVWHLPSGEFSWMRLEITDVGYNVFETY